MSIRITRPFRLSGSKNAITMVPAIEARKSKVSSHRVFLNISLIWVIGVARKQDLYRFGYYPMMLMICPIEYSMANCMVSCLMMKTTVVKKDSSHPMAKHMIQPMILVLSEHLQHFYTPSFISAYAPFSDYSKRPPPPLPFSLPMLLSY